LIKGKLLKISRRIILIWREWNVEVVKIIKMIRSYKSERRKIGESIIGEMEFWEF
jgi:hypothetical protein